MRLAGIVEIRGDRGRFWRVLKRERARIGTIGLLDAIAYRVFARIRYQRDDARWLEGEIDRLRRRYPAALEDVPRITVSDPNSDASREFIASLSPDLTIARCKFILKPGVFELAKHGSFALHPGICPEYRNAHGCFWALANRDLDRVGMTVVKIDRGIDTGPALLHASCAFDEVRESHTRIQYRVVTENLDRIADVLRDCANGIERPIDTSSRASAAWGQPRLSTYLRWKREARRQQRIDGVPAVP